MKYHIAFILGLLITIVTGCRDNNDDTKENYEDLGLKAELEIREFDSTQITNGYSEEGLGGVSNTFNEEEELAFYATLTNESLETYTVKWPWCDFYKVEVYDKDNKLVFHSFYRDVVCLAVEKVRVVYTEESINGIISWDQTVYATLDEKLTAGEYTVVSYIDVYIEKSNGEGFDVRLDMPEKKLTILADPL
ncbi:hypothetical protein [Kangiella sediminilitoris]|uniref:Intracellular proteinase inhibitor BsuPI domain-containing protein n=1 Tax=Kangiella sediminilitoris TaxID=1144748 RepID=A0A1B3B7H0_9GAMM|nr:hypothetical protein [Kangiella sediminilitoris]AOE48739.1 hypothetical protein KS2013_7 [Kangiella sediminilitoris]